MRLLRSALLLLSFSALFAAPPKGLVGRVNPFIGTGGHGHTFPGASAPFGGVQLSPDTRLDPGDWDGCGGYHYSDSRIHGFSHTHLSGTGVSDYCDVLFAPHTGDWRLTNGKNGKLGYGSAFDHASEKAWPGYYAVTLKDYGIRAELTATARAGFHRYTFPKGKAARLVIDLEHRDEVVESSLRFVGDREIEGYRRSRSWAKDQHVYFVARFSKPFVDHGLVVQGGLLSRASDARDKRLKAAVSFGDQGGAVLVSVGISAVSVDGARKNLSAEIPDWDFDAVLRQTERAWEKELSKITVEGGTKDQQTIFYTALYHAMLSPNVFQDVDGMYRGRDQAIHGAEPGTHYTVFSLWDTFRALHPLLTIIDRKRSSHFARTFLRQFEEGGQLPVWELAGNETDCMIGYHAVPVMADIILKGIGGFDVHKAFEAMKASAEQDRLGLKPYKALGYVPANEEGESVSKTLEYAYDDWCIAMVAQKLGRTADTERYLKRAQGFKHLFDPSTGFFRGRMEGHWWSPFDPREVNANFTEANAWQYAFFAPQDLDSLISFQGGKAGFAKKLDDLFSAQSQISGTAQADITGLIGQYAHGNEPSHHMAYLYSFAGQPWKTQAMVRRILEEFYRNDPDGLIGNEDCGQMSAWYVLSALGFYSVTPGSNTYVIGTPLFPKATLRLENGKTFTIRAPKVSAKASYIRSASLNGQNYEKSFLSHRAIQDGGELVFEMASEPNLQWGVGEGQAPRTAITEHLILPAPFVQSGSSHFRDATQVTLGALLPEVAIRYTLDGRAPDLDSKRYETPLSLGNSAVLKAAAFKEGTAPSSVMTAIFTKVPEGRQITLSGTYSRQYSAGGNTALIDGLRGGPHWRQGRWQGYQGRDLEAVVDLGKTQSIQRLAMGFIQDMRSWILMPLGVEFLLSTDGTEFRTMGLVRNELSDREDGIFCRDFAVTFAAVEARFVKVRIKNYGELQSWHPGAGSPSMFFCDEIVVE